MGITLQVSDDYLADLILRGESGEFTIDHIAKAAKMKRETLAKILAGMRETESIGYIRGEETIPECDEENFIETVSAAKTIVDLGKYPLWLVRRYIAGMESFAKILAQIDTELNPNGIEWSRPIPSGNASLLEPPEIKRSKHGAGNRVGTKAGRREGGRKTRENLESLTRMLARGHIERKK